METCLSFSACEQERRLLVASRFETVVEPPAAVNLDFISGLFWNTIHDRHDYWP